jgi:hypothetical protein
MYANAAAFLVDFPAFATAPPGVVSRCVDAAAAQIDETACGELAHQMHGLQAAHLISLEPGGQAARLSADDAETTYGVELKKLRLAAGCGSRVI